jgi:hypothetical protein
MKDIVDRYNSARVEPAPKEMLDEAMTEVVRLRARIAELGAALKDLREAAYDVDEMDMPFSQRNEWGRCLAKADEALKREK